MIPHGEIVLEGIVGSTAYGLSREGSDIDKIGVFVAPIDSFLGLHPGKESVVSHDPDVTHHEIKKYMSLALKCNPTITELMWLPDDLYTVRKSWGQVLIDLRADFLSDSYVRNAYGGYAMQQAQRLQRRDSDGSLADKDPKKIAKHARHCMRLMHQGIELLTYGRLTVKVPNPEYYWNFDHVSVEGIVEEFSELDWIMKNEVKSVLPDEPNIGSVEDALIFIRKWGLS